jgi:hypothetical protein
MIIITRLDISRMSKNIKYSTAFNKKTGFSRGKCIYAPQQNYIFQPAPDQKEQLPEVLDKFGEPDPLMDEKKEIMQDRGEVVRGKITGKKKGERKKKKPRLPGEKLMKKIVKNQQFEDIMAKVVKDLSILEIK